MNRHILSNISSLKENISTFYDTTTTKVNEKAVETYNTIEKTTSEISKVRDKISVLSDMFTDLRVLNGTSKNLTYLSSLPVVENKGIRIHNDTFNLDTLVKSLKEFSVKDSSISSLEKYTLNTLDNKRTSIDSFLKNNIDTLVTFPTTRYTFSLNLRYDNLEQINNIEIQLGLLTESFPIISSIKYIDKNNVEQNAIILNNTELNYDLDYNREIDNKYSLDISPILTDQLNIEFTSKVGSSVTLKNIKTYLKKEVTNGEVILGPIHINNPLLKLALDADDFSTGLKFSFSTDLDYWLPLDLSSIISPETNRKILSFNTINSNSIKSEEDIYSFYIKVEITSELLTNEDLPTDIYETRREDNSINNDKLNIIEDNLFSAYKVKNSDFIHGEYQYIENLNTKSFNFSNVEYIECNGKSKVLGLIESPYSITNENNISNGGIGAELKYKRLNSEKVNSSTQYDLANSKIFDIYLRDINSTINTKEKSNICLSLKRKVDNKGIDIPEDTYLIVSKDSRKSLQIDLTTPFILNSSSTIINVPYEDIIIRDSLGEVVYKEDKDNLLTIEELNEIGESTKYYFINLVDILFEPIEVEGYTYNKLYPLVALGDKEYGLERGRIITGKDILVNIKGKELIKTEVEVIKVVNYINGNYFKRIDDNFTYYDEQTIGDVALQNIVKLNNVSIEKGSIQIEEYYEDKTRYTSNPSSSFKFINVNTEEDPAYLDVDDNTYLQE